MARHESSSNAAAEIAAAAATFATELDQFFAQFDAATTERLEREIPWHGQINRDLVKRLERLSRELAPQEVMS